MDVRHLSDEEFEQLYAAWLEYGVLRLRNQSIDEDQLQAFSARFGPLEEIPFGRMSEADKAKVKNRYVTQLSNILVDGKPIGGLGNAEANWHSDMTYVETHRPPAFCWGWKYHLQVGTPTLPTSMPPTNHSLMSSRFDCRSDDQARCGSHEHREAATRIRTLR